MRTTSWAITVPERKLKVADDNNTKRSGSMDDIYYVYDDQGTYIRANEAVGQKIYP
jgi:hypothetical protein